MLHIILVWLVHAKNHVSCIDTESCNWDDLVFFGLKNMFIAQHVIQQFEMMWITVKELDTHGREVMNKVVDEFRAESIKKNILAGSIPTIINCMAHRTTSEEDPDWFTGAAKGFETKESFMR